MSNNKFTVDAVPTPRINLAGAFESDLGYYMKNGNKLPPLGKSQLKQLEEQLNDYLKFLNESFILKGFTKGALTISVINAGLIQDKEGKFVIDLDNSTWVIYGDDGKPAFSYDTKNGLQIVKGNLAGFSVQNSEMIGGTLRLSSEGYIDVGALQIRAHSLYYPELVVDGPSYADLALGAPAGVWLGTADAKTLGAGDTWVYMLGETINGLARCNDAYVSTSWSSIPFSQHVPWDATVTVNNTEDNDYVLKTRYNGGWQWCVKGSSGSTYASAFAIW